MRRWPDTLPTPSMPGFGLSPVDPALRTDMEVGAQRVRRITFARNDLVDMVWVMNDAEFAAFRAWWNDETWSIAGDSESLAAWTLSSATRAIGADLSPDGEIVDQLIDTVSNSLHYAQLALSGAADNKTILCRATLKPAGAQWARLTFGDRAGAHCYTNIDLINGIWGAQSGLLSRSMELRSDGSWRVTLTAPVSAGGAAPMMRVNVLSAAAASVYAGTGSAGLAVSEIGGAFSDVLAKHYGVSRNSRSNMALSSFDTSDRDAKPSSISRSFSVSMALRSLQAKINAPIRSITVIKALLVDFTIASRFTSSIRRLLVGKQESKPMSNDASGADDSGKVDNA